MRAIVIILLLLAGGMAGFWLGGTKATQNELDNIQRKIDVLEWIIPVVLKEE